MENFVCPPKGTGDREVRWAESIIWAVILLAGIALMFWFLNAWFDMANQVTDIVIEGYKK